MKSKLFTPVIREKRGDALDRTDEADMFQNVPLHAEVPNFIGPTDSGQPWYPLRLGAKTSQQNTAKPEKRPISSSPQEYTKY